jgi:ELWxxDGT repeat protein
MSSNLLLRKCFRNFHLSVFVFFFLFGQVTAIGQEIHLLKDISMYGGYSSSITKYVTYKDFVYFLAEVGTKGSELWKTDGTSGGTQLIKSFDYKKLGNANSLMVYKDKLYFIAETIEASKDIWVSDGTTAGTMVKFKGPIGSVNTFVWGLIENNGYLYYGTSSPSIGTKVYLTDGTSKILKTLDLTTWQQYPQRLMYFGNKVLFTSDEIDQDSSTSIWVTNDTFIKPKKLIGFENKNRKARITLEQSVHNKVYFSVKEEAKDYKTFWVTDGTQGGTKMILDLDPGNNGSNWPRVMAAIDSVLYFSASDQNHGYELWRTDGTSQGTYIVKDIIPGPTGSTLDNAYAIGGDQLFFAARDSNGMELWTTDGTKNGTFAVADIFKGEASGLPFYCDLIVLGDSIFISAQDSHFNIELWHIDAKNRSAELVKDINKTRSIRSEPSAFYPLKGKVIFRANDGINGFELWITDGSNSGTKLLKNISEGTGHSRPTDITNVGDKLYFIAQSNVERLLFQSDGTPDNTNPISDTSLTISPRSLTAVKDDLFFTGSTSKNGIEIWKVGATSNSPKLLKDINPGSPDSNPSFLTVIDSILYFTATNGVFPQTPIYSSGGFAVNTNVAVSFFSEHDQAIITSMASVDDLIYFRLNSSMYGNELWVSDGTQGGTKIVKDLCVGCSSAPRTKFQELFGHQGNVYFVAGNSFHGHELWRTGGTESATVMIYDAKKAGWNGNPHVLAFIDTTVIFVADGPGRKMSLWKTFNSSNTAEHIYNLTVSNENGGYISMQSDNKPPAAANSKYLFFGSREGGLGVELWRSDGTNQGTELVKDINVGVYGSYPRDFVSFNDTVYFSAYTEETGRELWRTDGTEDGTYMLEDLTPGAFDSNPFGLIVAKKRLYFTAEHEKYGKEVFYIEDTTMVIKEDPLPEPKQIDQIQIFPNPVRDNLTIRLPFVSPDGEMVTFYNMLGQKVKEYYLTKNNQTLNVSVLTQGAYVMIINNRKVYKLIKL